MRSSLWKIKLIAGIEVFLGLISTIAFILLTSLIVYLFRHPSSTGSEGLVVLYGFFACIVLSPFIILLIAGILSFRLHVWGRYINLFIVPPAMLIASLAVWWFFLRREGAFGILVSSIPFLMSVLLFYFFLSPGVKELFNANDD